MEETWKKLIYPKLEEKYNHYEVSTFGRIKNTKTGRILKSDTNRTGYCTVRVCTKDRNTKIHIIVHKAVAYTFLDNPNGYKEINHKDANRENNNVLNLEWCTAGYNQKYKYDIGSFDITKICGENNCNAKLDWEKVKYIRENYKRGDRVYGVRAMAREFGVSKTIVQRVIHNKGWVNESGIQ